MYRSFYVIFLLINLIVSGERIVLVSSLMKTLTPLMIGSGT